MIHDYGNRKKGGCQEEGVRPMRHTPRAADRVGRKNPNPIHATDMRRIIAAFVASAIMGCSTPQERSRTRIPEPSEDTVILLDPIEVTVPRTSGAIAN